MGRAYHHYRNYRKPKPNLKLVSDTTDTLRIQWLHDKYGNFIAILSRKLPPLQVGDECFFTKNIVY